MKATKGKENEWKFTSKKKNKGKKKEEGSKAEGGETSWAKEGEKGERGGERQKGALPRPPGRAAVFRKPAGAGAEKKEIHARGKTSKGEKHLLFSSAPGEDEQYVDTRRCLSQGFYGAFDKRG